MTTTDNTRQGQRTVTAIARQSKKKPRINPNCDSPLLNSVVVEVEQLKLSEHIEGRACDHADLVPVQHEYHEHAEVREHFATDGGDL